MLYSLYPVLLGFALDLLIGDPNWRFHPIRLMGDFIEASEKMLRGMFPKTERGEMAAGLCMTIVVAIIALLVPYLLLLLANMINPLLAFFLESILCCFALSTKSLKTETMKIYKLLVSGDIGKSREALSMIVGRDTEKLTEEGVIKASVETIAENTTDGVIAPMIFMILGGAPFAYFYKAVNTMDSMVGYRNQKYMFFGRYAAKLDDTLNYFPARIAAGIMIFVSNFFKRLDSRNAKRIYIRDRLKHASPNSGHTEAACAGALRIQLAGDAYYFGVRHKKEYIGDYLEKIVPENIIMANKLLYATAGAALLLFCSLKFALVFLLGGGL